MKYLIVLFFTASVVYSQAARSFSNEFLNIGVDARAFGMGNSVVANVNDVSSTYWNPAGLTQVKERWQAVAMHAEYFESIANYDYAAVAIPLDNQNTLGVSLYRFGVDDILNTTELIDTQGNIDFDRISTFSTADYALALSYAGNLRNTNLSVGANAKIIYRHIGPFANSFGFGLDLGVQYRSQTGFAFGAMARDITTTFNAWSINEDELNTITVTEPGETGNVVTVNELPEENIELTLPKLQVGVSQDIEFSDNLSLLGEIDLHFRFTQTNDLVSTNNLSMTPSAGVELNYNDLVFLRGGVGNFQTETDFGNNENITFQPNFGVGFKYRGVSVDYALTDIGNQSIALFSNIFSVKLDLAEFY